MKNILICLLVFVFFACTNSNNKENNSSLIKKNEDDKSVISKDKVKEIEKYQAYDELANEDDLNSFSISEYNTDNPEIENIIRPTKSRIVNCKIETTKVFGIWVQNPSSETPHATFELSTDYFTVADYDGDGDMPYLINKDSITVYYNDFIKKGKLIESKNKEELIIHWENSKRPTKYYTWKN